MLEKAIGEGEVPGAVVIVGQGDAVLYRRAFGWRALEPERERMTLDTVFDLASLTKPMVTATALMQLVEQGNVDVDDPLTKYLPECAANGKQAITVRMLATHYSGLRADLALTETWSGKEEALRRACAEKPVDAPGTKWRYSDINYILLGEVVERVSGQPLAEYAQRKIFAPLGMKETRFLPPDEWRRRILPTEADESGAMLRGVVHDPTARRMGGVAGHAGVFSTADDVARFARAMLAGGEAVLTAKSVALMTSPQQPGAANVLRGIGWDIDSPHSSPRGDWLPRGSFGHTGFTGTSLWIDPASRTYIVLLTHAVHPRGGKSAVPLRRRVANAVAKSLRIGALATTKEAGATQTGIDVLEASKFDLLRAPGAQRPRRIGLLTNETGKDSQGRRSIDVLGRAPDVELVAIFSPEHGITGAEDRADIADRRDGPTGLPVYSLNFANPATRRPRAEWLRGLDAVVVDLQDAGASFYTYYLTMAYMMEQAAKEGVEVVVLDRPNPVTGTVVEGPVSDANSASPLHPYVLPVRHGMTMGELARMLNGERKLGAWVSVVPMAGWRRRQWFDQTGLTWVAPSPNLPSVAAATLYPGVAMAEWSNVSVGRGTASPFEVLGAPWAEGDRLAAYLSRRKIPGVRFEAVQFTPLSSVYKGEACQGVRIAVTDRERLRTSRLGAELIAAMIRLYPAKYDLGRTADLVGDRGTVEALRRGEDPGVVSNRWQQKVKQFMRTRQRYLMY
ncbi:MAG TPA: serine hydrolase [Terriglobales bacterium]|nr:serine hydrolase [Terriglobales bacterium]